MQIKKSYQVSLKTETKKVHGGALGRERKDQSCPRERKRRRMKGQHLTKPWTTWGRHQAEPLRGKGSPGFLPSLVSYIQKWRNGKAWLQKLGIFKYISYRLRLIPRTCETLAAGVASFAVNIKRQNQNPLMSERPTGLLALLW